MNRDPKIFIQHILDNIEKIESFSKNISKEELFKNKLKPGLSSLKQRTLPSTPASPFSNQRAELRKTFKNPKIPSGKCFA